MCIAVGMVVVVEAVSAADVDFFALAAMGSVAFVANKERSYWSAACVRTVAAQFAYVSDFKLFIDEVFFLSSLLIVDFRF